MKEARIVPFRKKLASFTVIFCALHIYLAYSSYAIMGESYLESPAQLTVDGADFTFSAIVLGGIVEGILFFINIFAYVVINAILFTVYILIFNRLFYLTVADEGARFKKYANCIMLTLMLIGFIVPNVLNYKLFPLSLIPTLFDYLIFSFLAYLITMHKIRKTYQ